VFSLRLTSTSSNPISVGYFTADASALSNADYRPTNGTVTFPSGQTNATVRVTVIGDNLVEANEQFFLRLTNPVNATLLVTQAVCTILDDDPKPCLSFSRA